MEPDRFDDVESRILEGPEPPERTPARRRRWVVAAAVAIIAAGEVTAGAATLTGAGAEPAAKAAQRNADGIKFERSGPECNAGFGKRHHERDGWRSYAPLH